MWGISTVWKTFIFLVVATIGDMKPIDFGIICFVPICIVILFFVIAYKISKLNNSAKIYNQNLTQDSNKKQIEELAIQYIENRIKSVEDNLSFDDFNKFNNIVQIENNIKVPNGYNTEVPYQIREILYTAYLKKKRKLKK